MKHVKPDQRYEEIQVEEITFLCPLVGVKKQRSILFKIAGLAGVPLSSLISDELAESSGEKQETKGEQAMMGALVKVFAQLGDPKTEQVYEELIQTFLSHGAKARFQVDGSSAEPFIEHVYEKLFDQRIDLEAKFLWACLEANFRPFFERVRVVALVGFKKWQDKREDSDSQKGATGLS